MNKSNSSCNSYKVSTAYLLFQKTDKCFIFKPSELAQFSLSLEAIKTALKIKLLKSVV